MAKAVGISLRSVQRIWATHRLQPHRIRTFKRWNDSAFAEKIEDIVGLYVEQHNHDPKPFVWTKSPETILAKIDRLPVPSE